MFIRLVFTRTISVRRKGSQSACSSEQNHAHRAQMPRPLLSQNIDASVPDSLLSLANQVLTMATQIGLVLFFAPWVALAMPPLLFIYHRIYQRMRVSARDARRIAQMAHTPVFEYFADALSGRETINAFDVSHRVCAEEARRVANMSRAVVMTEAVQKWAQALSVQCGTLLYFVCGLVCVILHHFSMLETSKLGLVLLYAASLQRWAEV